MERLKPPHEEPDRTVPLFYCTSFRDLKNSRDEIIFEMKNWINNEAGFLTKLKHPYFSGLDLSARITRKEVETHARIYIPQIKRIPEADKQFNLMPDEITIWDGVNILKTKLPHRFILEKRNSEQIKEGKASITLNQLKGSWKGNILIYALFSANDRFTLLDVFNSHFPESQTEAKKVKNASKHLPKPSPI